MLLYPLPQHVAVHLAQVRVRVRVGVGVRLRLRVRLRLKGEVHLAQVDRVVQQRDLVRRVLELAVRHVPPQLPRLVRVRVRA